jgi:hypothetical protein
VIPAILAQIGGALLGGVVVGGLCGVGASVLLAGAGLGMGLLVAAVFAVIVGFGVGAGAGVALVGRLLGRAGSPWLAVLGGGLTGAGVALALRYLPPRLPIRLDLFLFPVVAAPLVVAGALIGYYLRRRQVPRDRGEHRPARPARR